MPLSSLLSVAGSSLLSVSTMSTKLGFDGFDRSSSQNDGLWIAKWAKNFHIGDFLFFDTGAVAGYYLRSSLVVLLDWQSCSEEV